jgi:hypothetical protein
MLPNGPKDRSDACYPMGRRIETNAGCPMGRRIEIDSLHPNPINPNNFLEVDLNILVLSTLFVLLRFKGGRYKTCDT